VLIRRSKIASVVVMTFGRKHVRFSPIPTPVDHTWSQQRLRGELQLGRCTRIRKSSDYESEIFHMYPS
jgi:hypothetical protein